MKNIITMREKRRREIELKKALVEMSDWEMNLTKRQRIEILMSEAQDEMITSVFKEYKNKIVL